MTDTDDPNHPAHCGVWVHLMRECLDIELRTRRLIDGIESKLESIRGGAPGTRPVNPTEPAHSGSMVFELTCGVDLCRWDTRHSSTQVLVWPIGSAIEASVIFRAVTRADDLPMALARIQAIFRPLKHPYESFRYTEHERHESHWSPFGPVGFNTWPRLPDMEWWRDE